jgi:hypothetical protein
MTQRVSVSTPSAALQGKGEGVAYPSAESRWSETCRRKSFAVRTDVDPGQRWWASFPMVLNAAPGSTVTSACLKFVDLAGVSTIALQREGKISINGGPFLPGPRPIAEGDEVRLQMIANTEPNGDSGGAFYLDSLPLGAFAARTRNDDRAPRTVRLKPTDTPTQIQSAMDQLRAGDVAEFESGEYAPLSVKRIGLPDKPITIRGVGPTRPVFKGGDFTINLAGSHFLVLENLEVTGGEWICIRAIGHMLVIRDTFVHDCKRNGILANDDNSGTVIIDRTEVTRVGAVIPGEPLHHAIYMATDRDLFPNATLRIQHSYVHDYRGNGIKSRAARTEIYYNWVEAPGVTDSYYSLELIGFQGPPPDQQQHSDVVGNVLVHRGQFGMRFGGDGAGASYGRVRLANNTVLLSPQMTLNSGAIRLYQALDSLYLLNNVFAQLDGATKPVSLFSTEIDAQSWVGGRIKLAGQSNLVPAGSRFTPGADAEWIGTRFGPAGLSATPPNWAIDTALTAGSVAIGAGAPLETTPPEYAVSKSLNNLAFRPPQSRPRSGQPIVVIPRPAVLSSPNIGSQ